MDQVEVPKTGERSLYLRVAVAVAWFIVVYVVARIGIGVIIGTFSGASTTDLEVAHAAGRSAADAFFDRYGVLFLIGCAAFTGALYWHGVLPWTSRNKGS